MFRKGHNAKHHLNKVARMEVKVTNLLPNMLAFQLFKTQYRKILTSAMVRLRENVDIQRVRLKFSDYEKDDEMQRCRERATNIIKIFIRMGKKRVRSFFYRWHMLTMMRNSVLANYNQIFNHSQNLILRRTKEGFISVNSDTKMYEKVKALVLNLSVSYSKKMTRIIADGMTKDPRFIKDDLNHELGNLVNDIMLRIQI